MEETQKKGKGVLWAVAVVLITVVTFGAVKLGKEDVVTSVDSSNPNTNEESGATQTTTYLYKDGTYSAVGSYTSPAGPEEVKIALTLKDDVITNAVVTPMATHEVSIKLQNLFIGGVNEVVVGKSIDDVVLDKVAGSSLTPKGWNDAIVKIQAQARI